MTNVRLSNSNADAIHVMWDDPCSTGCPPNRKASSYRIFYKPNNGAEKSIQINNPDSHSRWLEDLNSNTRFTIRIRTTISSTMNPIQFVASDRSKPVWTVTSKSTVSCLMVYR